MGSDKKRVVGGRKGPINPDNFVEAKKYSIGSILDLGSGNVKLADTTVDIDESTNPDVVHNLDEFPYPFEDNSYDTVWSIHVLEHLENPKKSLEEMKRIAKKRIVAIIPIGERDDPDHKRVYTKKKAIKDFDPDWTDVSSVGSYFDLVMIWNLFKGKVEERAGRAQDKEKIMERLREMGYW